jgi:hypothetical protein
MHSMMVDNRANQGEHHSINETRILNINEIISGWNEKEIERQEAEVTFAIHFKNNFYNSINTNIPQAESVEYLVQFSVVFIKNIIYLKSKLLIFCWNGNCLKRKRINVWGYSTCTCTSSEQFQNNSRVDCPKFFITCIGIVL